MPRSRGTDIRRIFDFVKQASEAGHVETAEGGSGPSLVGIGRIRLGRTLETHSVSLGEAIHLSEIGDLLDMRDRRRSHLFGMRSRPYVASWNCSKRCNSSSIRALCRFFPFPIHVHCWTSKRLFSRSALRSIAATI